MGTTEIPTIIPYDFFRTEPGRGRNWREYFSARNHFIRRLRPDDFILHSNGRPDWAGYAALQRLSPSWTYLAIEYYDRTEKQMRGKSKEMNTHDCFRLECVKLFVELGCLHAGYETAGVFLINNGPLDVWDNNEAEGFGPGVYFVSEQDALAYIKNARVEPTVPGIRGCGMISKVLTTWDRNGFHSAS